MKKRIIIIILMLSVFIGSIAQTFTQSSYCDIKWYPVKYIEIDRTSNPVPKAQKDEFILFHCDGRFESIENKKPVTGEWKYQSNQFIITQKENKNFPNEVKFKMVSVTEKELIMIGIDADGDELKMYFEKR